MADPTPTLFAQDRMLTPLRAPTPEDIADWLHEHPDQVVAVLQHAYVADAWVEEDDVWSRSEVGLDPEDHLAMVSYDEDEGCWVVELRDVEHDFDYATADEARTAADQVLDEDGYALVGGVHHAAT